MKWESLLFAPFVGFIAAPWAALAPAAAFLGAYAWKQVKAARLAGVLWTCYAAYESAMKARILCSGECNIRVDLLLVIPVLWIVSIVALVKLLRTKGRHGAS
ncbi:MAG TPA: hypothetical protein VFV74_07370 [Burkholderiales bacterium]|nr:hypothetical protein [Burkholderiales bacterium]